MSRRRTVQRATVAAGLTLVAGLLLAPLVPTGWILPLSGLWYLALAVLLWSGWLVLARWLGRRGALAVVALSVASPIVLSSVPAPPSLALLLPCPRNWGRLPTWLLRPSPMGSLRFEVGGARVKLCYGRPAARGRRMLGGSRVPYGQLWRTGANEPTTLIATGPFSLGGIPVPAGRSALYTIPGPESWELIVTGSTSQWGHESEYTTAVRAREVGRAILPSERADPVQRLTFRLEREANGNSNPPDLVLSWEATGLRIPVRPVSR